MLVNENNQVLVAKRVPKKVAGKEDIYWQMPQGGVDSNEDYEKAALRELQEETGIPPDQVEVIAVSKNWYTYEIPEALQKRHFKSQTQKWFLVKFLGDDSIINLEQDHAEFCAWQWVDFKKVPKLVIDFKRDVYRQVCKDFQWFFEED